jgi:hypothetical protein
MKTSKKLLAIVFVLLLTPGLLLAQKKLSDWNNVAQLKPGTKIIVTTRNGREFIGEKRQANDDMMFMETISAVNSSRTISLSRDEIAEVRKKKSSGFMPFIGAAIGVAVGAGIGAAVYDHPGTDDPHSGAMVMGALGGLIGGGAGAFVHHNKSKIIYVAP